MLSPDGKDEGSQARSTKGREQYIVLATDGAPSGTQEIDPESAAKAANALGQSLVTIGIGDAVNKELLELIGDRYSLMVESVMDATRSTNLIADELCKGAPNPSKMLLRSENRMHAWINGCIIATGNHRDDNQLLLTAHALYSRCGSSNTAQSSCQGM